MNILIITQSIDKNNPVLGFFHGWTKEFARQFNKVSVVCLEIGEYELPQNVNIFSLGKEKNNGKKNFFTKIRYILDFYKYIWKVRSNYDVVFVHMNQEYVLLAGILWRILGKKIFMWRNHPVGNLLTKIAIILSHKVFCTSHDSFTAKYSKTQIMPVGIDTTVFKPDNSASKVPNSILSIGRIAPIKKIDLLVSALSVLHKKGVDFVVNIYGGFLDEHKNYYEKILQEVANLDLSSHISFHGPIKHENTVAEYQKNNVFVNLTEAGTFDKTILESMSCGMKVVTSNPMLKDHLVDKWFVSNLDAEHVADALAAALADNGTSAPFKYVESNHSLSKLVSIIAKESKNA